MDEPLLRMVDAVTLAVPTLEAGLAFYVEHLGHELAWRDDELGQAGLRCPDTDTEIVLTTSMGAEPNWLVRSADQAAATIAAAGGSVVAAPRDIPVGRVAVVEDPFGNRLVLVDLSKGRYRTGADGSVVGVDPSGPDPEGTTP
ncbi:VOC family protein [Pseudactinotalea suaedae]|uniref:VOC family protein n=1 Tax=Pseudactinotalea suaedae TaxID=1524924 RepID=UPI0012E185F8|nr:VOC family protein [Pseudactinotalea suaedae]